MRPAAALGRRRGSFSTAEWMRLVVLAAFNLMLFQGAWWIVFFPPIGMLVVAINVALFAAWVRRRRMTRPELAASFTALLAATAMLGYFAAAGYPSAFPWLIRLLATGLPEGLAARLLWPILNGSVNEWHVEFAILHSLGLLGVLSAALLVHRLRSPRVASPPSP